MLFVIDFDGTLALGDTVDALLAQYAHAAWRDVEQQWLDGHIDAVECMKRQIRMVSASREALEHYFQSINIDTDFFPFYSHVSRFANVAVVSDGLHEAITFALAKSGIPALPVFANHLLYHSDGIEIIFPRLTDACTAGNGVCKCAVSRELSDSPPHGPGGPVVLVGDGKSDACLANQADVVFAKNWLLDHCVAEGIAHIPFSSFADVLETVKTWPAYGSRAESTTG